MIQPSIVLIYGKAELSLTEQRLSWYHSEACFKLNILYLTASRICWRFFYARVLRSDLLCPGTPAGVGSDEAQQRLVLGRAGLGLILRPPNGDLVLAGDALP